MAFGRHGEVMQSGLERDPNDFARIDHPVVGVIWRVSVADDPLNVISGEYADGRAYAATAHVVVVDDGTQNTWEIPQAVLPAPGPGGWSNYAEWLPQGCTQAVDGTDFRDVSVVDYSLLDGEWCVVQFIGGVVTKPVVTGFLPHPRNRLDPATGGWRDGTLEQAGRGPTVRWAGTTLVWGKDGSLALDTSGANETVRGSAGDVPVREVPDDGGDVQVDMKPTAAFELNFNTAPESQPGNPTAMQPNPPDPAAVAASEAYQAAQRAAAEADRVARAAADSARAVALLGASALVPPTQALVVAAQTAYDTAKGAYDTAKDAIDRIASAETTARDLARAAAIALGDQAAIAEQAKLTAAALLSDAREALRDAGDALAGQAELLASFEALADEATTAVAAWGEGLTEGNRNATRLDPSGQLYRARTVASFDGDDAEIVAGDTARVMARGGDDSVEVGGTPESPPEYHAALAEPLETAFDVNANALFGLISSLNEVRAILGLVPYDADTATFPSAARAKATKVK
jgi:hypothetical protein